MQEKGLTRNQKIIFSCSSISIMTFPLSCFFLSQFLAKKLNLNFLIKDTKFNLLLKNLNISNDIILALCMTFTFIFICNIVYAAYKASSEENFIRSKGKAKFFVSYVSCLLVSGSIAVSTAAFLNMSEPLNHYPLIGMFILLAAFAIPMACFIYQFNRNMIDFSDSQSPPSNLINNLLYNAPNNTIPNVPTAPPPSYYN